MLLAFLKTTCMASVGVCDGFIRWNGSRIILKLNPCAIGSLSVKCQNMSRTLMLMVLTDTDSSLSYTVHFSGGISRIASVFLDKCILSTSMSDFSPASERQGISKASPEEARWICQGEVMYEMSFHSPMVDLMGFCELYNLAEFSLTVVCNN